MVSNTTMYRCDECGRYLSRKYDLDRHMRLHAPNKESLMYPCPYPGCKYKALQHSNLRTHMNTHTGERPHKCPDEGCDFTTCDPGSLTKHRQKKHGYNPKEKKSTSVCKKSQQQHRFAPYSTSSRPLRSGSASALSDEPSPSSSEPQVPPQVPQLVDACPPSSVLPADERPQKLKNSTLAFETELALTYAQAHDSSLGTALDPPSASLSGTMPCTVPFTEPELPTGELAQLMYQLEREGPCTLNQLDTPVSQPVPQSDGDAEFERFLTRYGDYLAGSSSVPDTTAQADPFTIGNTYIQTALPTTSLNTIDDMLVSSTLFLPPPNTQYQHYQYGADNTIHTSYDNCNSYTQPTTFDVEYARPSQAASLGLGGCPQTVASNPTHSYYTAPAAPSAFAAMRDLYVF